MIIYSSTKSQFNEDVNLNRISDIILQNLREKGVAGGQRPEYMSWQNSLHYMRAAIDDPAIAGDMQVAIEYQIPRTSKRVDFMIAGADKDSKSNVVVVELKQWEKAEKVDDDIYSTWLEEAPLFDKTQVLQLRDFIKRFVTKRPGAAI